MCRHVHDMVLVTDQELGEVIRLPLRTTHNLQKCRAASTAAALKMCATLTGKTVVGILSGGNLDLRELARIVG